jgi:MoaA/NifB/PqqE/SkfB family radical SAM enzyme
MRLTILYRGPLASCNYDCHYCPFAKRRENSVERAADVRALARFIEWIAAHSEIEFSILFTPWGEALNRLRYQRALAHLSHLAHVRRVAIQTNLSGRLAWLADADKQRLALWTTYHPGEVTRARFLAQCRELDQYGVRYSVGVVGLKQHYAEISALRRELEPQVYLWINAYKDQADYYDHEDEQFLASIDPLFQINAIDHESFGKRCRAGESVISVDGDGTIRRCHFIAAPIGNIYQDDFLKALKARVCSNQVCRCHIGYVHMEELGLYEIFRDGVLERIPAQPLKYSVAIENNAIVNLKTKV